MHDFFFEPVGIPAGIIDRFGLFASKTNFTSRQVRFVKERISLYSNDLTESVNINKRRYRENNSYEQIGDVLENFHFSPLEKYLAEVQTNIDEWKCFAQLYKLLNRQFHSYCSPFVMNYEKITGFVVGSKLCDWTTDEEFASDWARWSQVTWTLTVFSITRVICSIP